MLGRESRPGIVALLTRPARRRRGAAADGKEEHTMHRGMQTFTLTAAVGAGVIVLVLILLWLK
jgi:hypothetical protein